LHGGGKGAGDAGGAASTFGPIASKLKCVGIFPEVLVKSERGWTTDGTEEFVLELIEQAKKTWNIDPDRVYMVGHSMGGYGSWTVGAHHADLFAGLAPYAGAPTPITEDGSAYGKVVGLVDGVIPNLRNVALHVYQSLDDVQVPPEPNVYANTVVLDWQKDYGGYRYKYVEVDGRGHGAPPGGHVLGVKWIYESKRNARPKRVLWQPVLAWKRMFYWLGWDRPERGILVEANIKKPNEIELDLGGADRAGFRVFLDNQLVDLEKEVVIREGGDEVFRGKVKRTLTAMLRCAATKYDAKNLYPVVIELPADD
jgi:poly(3-hydroxybutyrate) depolymerase